MNTLLPPAFEKGQCVFQKNFPKFENKCHKIHFAYTYIVKGKNTENATLEKP